jgi:hypothetical protein
MSSIQPTLVTTGALGGYNDGFKAVDAKFKELIVPYKNLSMLQEGRYYEYSFDAITNTTIVYNDTDVSIVIDEQEYVVGIPGSLTDLIDLLNDLDIGQFYLNDAQNNIIAEGFHVFGDIIQNEMIVFSAGTHTDNDNIPSQADINRELALLVSNVSSTAVGLGWNIGGNELLTKGLLGSINNQHVGIIVNSIEQLTFRINGSWHRENKLFSIAYSESNTSWGHAALTLMQDGLIGNSAFGGEALSKLTTGQYSTGLGNNALKVSVEGIYNTGAGYNAGKDLITGDDNTFFGARSGKSLVTGYATTFVGSNTSTTTDNIHSSIALGFNVTLTKSNQFVIGANPDGDGYGGINEMLTYYAASRSHTYFYTQASPVGVLTAERGSIAWVNTGSVGQAWLKTGATINSWEMIQTTTALAITNQEVVFGNGTTIVSSVNFKFNTSNNRLTVNGEIYAGNSTGAVTDSLIKLSNVDSTSFFFVSTVTPESAITAPRSSLTLVNTGSLGRAYLKTSSALSTGWDEVATLAATQTFTNKRITKRVGTTTSSATPTINTDNVDMFTITALAAAITSFTTNLSGTPTTGQILRIRIKDDGTARAITWGASFATRIGTLPTTTVISKYLYVVFEWNEVASVWDCMATGQEA